MDVWRITIAALRRWYVLLPLLALTGFAVINVGNSVAPEYEARVSAMIMPERVEAAVLNPYGGPDQANAALGIVLDSVDSRETINEQGLASDYEVGSQSRSTIFQVLIRADTRAIAEQTGVAVVDLAQQELAARQTEAGLPEAARYKLAVLEPPAVTDIVQTGKTRIQAVVGVLGAGLSLLMAVLFDDIVGLIRRFRARGADRQADETASDDPGLPSVPTGHATSTPSTVGTLHAGSAASDSPDPAESPSGPHADVDVPAERLAGSNAEHWSSDDADSPGSSHVEGQRRADYEVTRRP